MITTRTHALSQIVPTFSPSEAPDYQSDGGSKNILRKYFVCLFCALNFSRPTIFGLCRRKEGFRLI